jgi:hypothetical protein
MSHHIQRLALILALCSVVATHAVSAAETPFDPVVARRMGAFYEVFTGRKLSADEIRKLTGEFVAGHARSGKKLEATRQVAWEFGIGLILLREDKESPAALAWRHGLLEGNYFRPEMQNTFELRLMTEPDAVRVVDARSKRLMTARDIVALANIRRFATSDGAPRHKELTPGQIEELASLLNRGVATSGTLPQFFSDAAAYWAGVRQQWPYFSAQQRSIARAYANNTWRTNMPVEMYVSLWGLDRVSASRRWTADVSARIRGGADGIGDLNRLQAAMDSMF